MNRSRFSVGGSGFRVPLAPRLPRALTRSSARQRLARQVHVPPQDLARRKPRGLPRATASARAWRLLPGLLAVDGVSPRHAGPPLLGQPWVAPALGGQLSLRDRWEKLAACRGLLGPVFTCPKMSRNHRSATCPVHSPVGLWVYTPGAQDLEGTS